MKREQQQQDLGLASRTIGGAINKNAVLKAIATDNDGVEHVLETQKEMVPAMAESNLRRQQQCQGTPSMMLPFLDDFGYLANTPAAMSIIEGTYVPPAGTNPYLVEFLSCLEMLPSIQASPLFPVVINEQDNRLAWIKQCEQTAGEPSCLGFSHYKAASLNPMLNSVDIVLRMVPVNVKLISDTVYGTV